MKHLFWLVDNELCGRPGPNHEPWDAVDLQRAGIGAILSVNGGESVHLGELEQVGIAHKCVPHNANAPPMPGELELCVKRLPIAYAFVIDHVENGTSTLQARQRSHLSIHGLLPETTLRDHDFSSS